MLHVVLFQPEIAPNTGNVGRLCAITESRLHLIHPLGFEITAKHLRRAGMDYWRSLDVVEHADWPAFVNSPSAPKRCWLFSTRADTPFWDAELRDGDGLVFGNEGSGCPDWLHDELAERRVQIPQPARALRSLNLATAVGIAVYEGLRQLR